MSVFLLSPANTGVSLQILLMTALFKLSHIIMFDASLFWLVEVLGSSKTLCGDWKNKSAETLVAAVFIALLVSELKLL